MSLSTDRFQVPVPPAEWSDWTFTQKVNWTINNARPRPSYSEACSILAQHAAARKRARVAAAMAQQRRAERVSK